MAPPASLPLKPPIPASRLGKNPQDRRASARPTMLFFHIFEFVIFSRPQRGKIRRRSVSISAEWLRHGRPVDREEEEEEEEAVI